MTNEDQVYFYNRANAEQDAKREHVIEQQSLSKIPPASEPEKEVAKIMADAAKKDKTVGGMSLADLGKVGALAFFRAWTDETKTAETAKDKSVKKSEAPASQAEETQADKYKPIWV